LLTAAPLAIYIGGAFDRRWLHDDGFINLRVVRNLLEGHGPVYNLGERVEAFTSPLWIALVATFGAMQLRLEDVAVYGGLLLSIAGLALSQLAAHICAPKTAHSSAWRVPLGALVFAVLPPAWDFATSGLETGLALFWLAASFTTVVWLAKRRASTSPRDSRSAWFAAAVLLGLGFLVRPELSLHSAALLVALGYGFDARRDPTRQSPAARLTALALLLLTAVALPGAYQIFRMGYFGALTANTAIAKEAMRENVSQGWCYFRNFFELYAFAGPAAVLAIFGSVAAIEFIGRRRAADDRLAHGDPTIALASVLLVGAALLHVAYIVVIGGDYMHGRMFLPAVFAAILPFATIDVRAPSGATTETATRVLLASLLGAWALVCAATLRVASENQCNIGDERGWYTRQANADHPTRLEDYRAMDFFGIATRLESRLKPSCPSAFVPGASLGSCQRAIELESGEGDGLSVNSPSSFVTRPIDPGVGGVAACGAIGLVGYALPSTIHVVDRHGLSDPIGARLAVEGRGRPGHEKRLTDAWILARFTAPSYPEDARLSAARRALECGRLRALFARVRAPLSVESFFQNITRAWWMQRLRIPADPFAAEAAFCGAALPEAVGAGGGGGHAFSWRCPDGMSLVGVRGAIDDDAEAISEVVGRCRPHVTNGRPEDRVPIIDGPGEGKGHDHRFELECPAGSTVVGLFGRASHLVHQLGLLCAEPHAIRTTTAVVGPERGPSFEIACPPGDSAVGIMGRSGNLIDHAGVLCRAIP
jgi:arabinofuranosyltransferase